jgi:PPOX class probable F420-dependent enzyme
MKLPRDAQRHLATDHVAWLTTVTAKEVPAPVPVWFVVEDDAIIVFTPPASRKVANIEARPTVTLHFNSDIDGLDIVVLTAQAIVEHDTLPSAHPHYIDKYRRAIAGLGMTVEEFDRTFTTCIRLLVRRVRLGESS